MSIRLLNQVLDLQLRPAEKLVLSVLADLANDAGVCWPSLAYVAPRASVSIRTLQRIIYSLETQGLIVRHPRYRADGSRTSSEFKILLNNQGGDKLSPPSAGRGRSPASRVTGGHDIPDTPLPHREPLKENHHHQLKHLIHPRGFDESSIKSAGALLAGISTEDAQSLLDEVAARMASGKVKSPLSYLRALIKRFKAGEFIPELGNEVSKQRCIKKAEVVQLEPTRQLPRKDVEQHLSNLRKIIARGGQS